MIEMHIHNKSHESSHYFLFLGSIVDLLKEDSTQEKLEEVGRIIYQNDSVTINLLAAAAAVGLLLLCKSYNLIWIYKYLYALKHDKRKTNNTHNKKEISTKFYTKMNCQLNTFYLIKTKRKCSISLTLPGRGSQMHPESAPSRVKFFQLTRSNVKLCLNKINWKMSTTTRLWKIKFWSLECSYTH